MSGISTETRLQLVRQIREENRQNYAALHNREALLYGYTVPYSYEHEAEGILTETATGSTFKIRLLLALILFACYFFLDTGRQEIAGVDTTKIQSAINQSFSLDLEKGFSEIAGDFIREIPATD